MKGRLVAIVIGAVALILIIAALVFPNTDAGMRIPFNQRSAAGTLRTLNDAQREFRKENRGNSFACQLSHLKSSLGTSAIGFRQPSFYIDGVAGGYIFAIKNCPPTSLAAHYQMTAIPRLPGQSGKDAYCTDEEGIIWYDESGDAAKCLANRKPLE